MIADVTDDVSTKSADEIAKALKAISALKEFCGRETLSAALGEVSEVILARHLGAERSSRNSRGHDLVLPNGDKIEVKSRIVSKWGDDLMFDFRPETKNCKYAYCVVWHENDGHVNLQQVIRVAVPYLTERWAVSQPKYNARTKLGKLKLALKENGYQ